MVTEILADGEPVPVVVPSPVPASKHVGIVPFVPVLVVERSWMDRVRGWFG